MNPEVHKIIKKAEEFYDDAKYLFQGKRFEATVNRCYYAMFTAVQALLLSKNAFSKTHHGAQIKFNELFIKTELLPIEFGKLLNEAFEKRQFGDYDVDADISESDALKLLENARMFLDRIKLFLV